jgi:hypothetical protein
MTNRSRICCPAKPETGAGPPRITGLSSTPVCGFYAAGPTGAIFFPSATATGKAPTRSALLAGPRRAFGRRFSRSWRPTRATRVPHDRHEHRVRAHQSRQPREKGEPKREALGRSRGGLCTKIHMLTDAFWAVHCASLLPRVMSSTTALSGESPARRL